MRGRQAMKYLRALLFCTLLAVTGTAVLFTTFPTTAKADCRPNQPC
jgi:hypothetical protein